MATSIGANISEAKINNRRIYMAEINKAPRGTNDVLPEESYKWQFVEQKLLETAGLYGFREIRVPVFEHTEVFF